MTMNGDDGPGYDTRLLEQEVDHRHVNSLAALRDDFDNHLDAYLAQYGVAADRYGADALTWDAVYETNSADDPGLLEAMMPAIGGDRSGHDDELTITGDALQATFYEETGTVWAYIRQTDSVADRPPVDVFDALTVRDKALDTYIGQRFRDPRNKEPAQHPVDS